MVDAPAAPKKMTPAEKLADILQSPDVVKRLTEGNPNGQQAAADVQDMIAEYLKGNEALLVTYVEATQKTAEARLMAGLPAEKAAGEEEAIKKLPKAQRRAIEDAEEAEKDALEKVGKVMAKSAPPSDPANKDPMAPEKAVIETIARSYSAPKAKEAHDAMLAKVKDTLIKKQGGLIFSTVSDRIKNVDKASKDTSDAGKAQLEEAKAELKKAISKDRDSRDLSEKDQQALFDSLVGNASAAVAENKKANPVISKVQDMAAEARDEAVKQAKELPGSMVTSVIDPTGANAPLLNIAAKIIPGVKTP